MNAKQGTQFLIALIAGKYITPADLEKAIEIAATKSPSAAFGAAQLYYITRHGQGVSNSYLGFAKGTRWLAVLRRDQGLQVFEAEAEKLRLQARVATKQVEWRLADGSRVIDRDDSHFLSQHREVWAILPEALAKINLQGLDFLSVQVDMGRVVGQTIRVETKPWDEIVYAQRLGRQGLTRLVKNRQPEPCSSVVVVLKKGNGNYYVLMTAFFGTNCPLEPWDPLLTTPEERREAVEFWNRNALLWDYQDIVAGTETTACPW